MRVVVSGSRSITDANAVERELRSYLACKDEVVTGGAQGVDAIAHDYAYRMFCKTEVVEAEWDRFGKQAGPIRNRKMLEDADMLVAIWDGKSRGTKNAIQTALELGVKTHVHFVEAK